MWCSVDSSVPQPARGLVVGAGVFVLRSIVFCEGPDDGMLKRGQPAGVSVQTALHLSL